MEVLIFLTVFAVAVIALVNMFGGKNSAPRETRW